MVASASSPADIVNLALARSGNDARVDNLFDGSDLASKALDVFSQTRDALLRESDWGFPRRDTVLSLLKSAPAGGYIPGVSTWTPADNPPRPYWYEYAYPADCIMLRAIRPPSMFQPEWAPAPQNWEIANDAIPVTGQSTAPGRVILCYLPDAVATYCGQVTDMTQWDIGFVEALANEMARVFQAGRPRQQGEQPMAYPGAVLPVHTVVRQG